MEDNHPLVQPSCSPQELISCLLFLCVDKWINITVVSYVPFFFLIKTAGSLRWCSQGLETATKQKLMSSLTNMCVKQEVFFHGVALLKLCIDTMLVLASSLLPIWSLLSMSKDNFLTILVGILTHWRWGFLGKVAFFPANPWKIQRVKPATLIKYELSLIHIFCGETDSLGPIICLLFVCVGSGTGPTSAITPSLMK